MIEPELKNVQIEITNRCNLECLHCYANSCKNSRSELTTNEIKNIIKEASDLGCNDISLSGGEPLLHKNVVDVMRIVKDYGLKLTVNTNGTLLNEKIIKIMGHLEVDLVTVSIHGYHAKTHDFITQSHGSWSKAVESIEELIKNNIPVGIATAITKVNMNEVPLIARSLRELDIRAFFTFRFLPIGRGKMNKDILDLSPIEHKSIMAKLFNFHDIKKYTYIEVPYIMGSKSNKIKIISCQAGINTCTISSNGDVLACAGLRDERIVAGNIKREDFGHIWYNSKSLNLLRSMQPPSSCSHCKWVAVCRGGCRAAALAYTGNVLSADPTCWFHQNCR